MFSFFLSSSYFLSFPIFFSHHSFIHQTFTEHLLCCRHWRLKGWYGMVSAIQEQWVWIGVWALPSSVLLSNWPVIPSDGTQRYQPQHIQMYKSFEYLKWQYYSTEFIRYKECYLLDGGCCLSYISSCSLGRKSLSVAPRWSPNSTAGASVKYFPRDIKQDSKSYLSFVLTGFLVWDFAQWVSVSDDRRVQY